MGGTREKGAEAKRREEMNPENIKVTVTKPVWFRVRGLCKLLNTNDVTECRKDPTTGRNGHLVESSLRLYRYRGTKILIFKANI
jgi:hypothetical protein